MTTSVWAWIARCRHVWQMCFLPEGDALICNAWLSACMAHTFLSCCRSACLPAAHGEGPVDAVLPHAHPPTCPACRFQACRSTIT